MWYDCEEQQYYLRLRAGGGVVNTAVSGTELSTWCWNCPLRCRWSGWNDQLVVGLQIETERESKREENKRQQYLVICISLSNFFFFRGKYKQLEVCPYHTQIVFDLSLIWFERQVLIAIILLLLLLPVARKWLTGRQKQRSCCCCCCWRCGDLVLGFRLQPEENLRSNRFALTASDCIWGSHSGRVSAISKWEWAWGRGDWGMKMALAFQLKLQKRLSSYADDVYWLYTHAAHTQTYTEKHLQHTHTQTHRSENTRIYILIFILAWFFLFSHLW